MYMIMYIYIHACIHTYIFTRKSMIMLMNATYYPVPTLRALHV